MLPIRRLFSPPVKPAFDPGVVTRLAFLADSGATLPPWAIDDLYALGTYPSDSPDPVVWTMATPLEKFSDYVSARAGDDSSAPLLQAFLDTALPRLELAISQGASYRPLERRKPVRDTAAVTVLALCARYARVVDEGRDGPYSHRVREAAVALSAAELSPVSENTALLRATALQDAKSSLGLPAAGSASKFAPLAPGVGVNVRDLAGTPIGEEGLLLSPGRLIRGESPALLSEDDLSALYDAGVRTVVDLRSDGEIAHQGIGPLSRWVEAGLIRHEKVGLMPSQEFKNSPSGKDPYNHLDEAYVSCMTASSSRLIPALDRAMASGGVYVCCALGKDRTGIVIASLLGALGAPPAVIEEDYLKTNEGLPSLVSRLKGDPHYPEFENPNWDQLTASPHVIRGALSRMGSLSEVHKWWAAAGAGSATMKGWAGAMTRRSFSLAPKKGLGAFHTI